MLDVYLNAIKNSDLSGPTYFGEILANLQMSAEQLKKETSNE